jgi:kinesin family protein 5
VYLAPDNLLFTFDRVFSPGATQESVYESVGFNTVADVLNGYNGTIFTYGQTGSGKTYTMFGELLLDPGRYGIIPRACTHIFEHILAEKEKYKDQPYDYLVTCSMVEIYKETLNDLINTGKTDLKLKENAARGVFVDGLTYVVTLHRFAPRKCNELCVDCSK